MKYTDKTLKRLRAGSAIGMMACLIALLYIAIIDFNKHIKFSLVGFLLVATIFFAAGYLNSNYTLMKRQEEREKDPLKDLREYKFYEVSNKTGTSLTKVVYV